ncbi:MAG: hypothetical protein GY711_13660, partial [bacterium]|nr:hypothetical protein [bacterium]
MRLSLQLLSALTLLAPVFAQGADDCANAQPITGLGPHSFDNSAATTDGGPDPLCDTFGTQDIENDVWFTWTAPATSSYRLNTCGLTGVDTKIAVYAGGCGTAALACNDDSCGLQSEVSFSTTMGSSYLIRVGTFPGATGGIGDFQIFDNSPILNPANGHYYQRVDNAVDWDTARAASEAAIWLGAPGHLVTFSDDAEKDFVVNTLGADRPWIGGFQDVNDPNYSEPTGGWKWVTGEPFTYTNWQTGEPNDNPAGENWIEMFASGVWNDITSPNGSTSSYIIEWEPGGGLGMNYCGPAIPNSSGQAATISAQGSPFVAANNVTLTADDMPAGQFGYFLAGQTQGFFNPPGSQGLICLAGNIGRYNAVADIIQGPSGSLALDLAAIPVNPPVAVIAGETWSFQCWFR